MIYGYDNTYAVTATALKISSQGSLFMKNHRYQMSLPLLISAAVSAALPGIATAQLEEVIVTSERREASVQDVPIAVSAFGEELVEQLQIDDTLDLIHGAQPLRWKQHGSGYGQHVLPGGAG